MGLLKYFQIVSLTLLFVMIGFQGLLAQPGVTDQNPSLLDLSDKFSPTEISYSNAPAENDSAIRAINRRARNTALQSMLVPGLGQINNGQWWKAPIIWASLGISVYFTVRNSKQYNEFAKAYRLRTDGDSTTIDKYDPRTDNPITYSSASSLREGRETYSRYRTLNYITTGLLYLANVVDAYVFAHLKDFNISDDLSMSVNPPKIGNIASHKTFMAGITLKFK